MYSVVYSDQAITQLSDLDRVSKKKILKAIEIFKVLGKDAKNSKNLGLSLWEIKADNVRAYFEYEDNKIIIVGLVVLKKSQKAPKRYIEQARKNIEQARLQLSQKE